MLQRLLLFLGSFLLVNFCMAQVPTKLDLCRVEIHELERKLDKCSYIQEAQNKELTELKTKALRQYL